MAKQRKEVSAFATFHPDTGLNSYWVRSQAKQIRGDPDTSQRRIWEDAVKRGWRIVRVKVSLDNQ